MGRKRKKQICMDTENNESHLKNSKCITWLLSKMQSRDAYNPSFDKNISDEQSFQSWIQKLWQIFVFSFYAAIKLMNQL